MWNSYSKIIVVNNSLFIVGGNHNNVILKWDSESKIFTQFSAMYNQIKIQEFGVIYNPKKHCLVLFGGYDRHIGDVTDYILEFNIKTKQWNKLSASLPRKMDNICCTLAVNNKYALLFGGRDNSANRFDDIYIYSFKDKTIRVSKIKCPSKGTFECVAVNDNIKDEKLVFGYVRNEWQICNIYDHYFPPNYLIKLIHSFYLNEFVHLMDERTKQHYKISTLDIILNV